MFPFTKHKEVVHVDETIIVIEGERYNKHDHDHDKAELHIIEKLLAIIEKLIKPVQNRKPIFALTIIINRQTFIMSDIVLALGTNKTGVFALLDNKTLQPIPDASFSNQQVGVNTNPGAATFAIDSASPNSPVATPVAVGSGSVVFSADASYTDLGDGSSQTGSFSITKNFTVVASPDGASLDVVFS